MICAPAISTVAKRERRIVPPSPPTPPTTNSPPDHFGIGEGSLVPFTLWGGSPKQPARSLIVCVARVLCPRRAAAVPSGSHSPPPEEPPAALPAPRREPGPRTGRGPRRPGPGPRSALGPSARFFVARPQRSIAPSPAPAAGKGHPRTGGGGAAPGTLAREARRPSHPGQRGCFWLGSAPSCLAFPFCVSLISACLSGQTAVYHSLALVLLLLLVLSSTLRCSVHLSLSGWLSAPGPLGTAIPSPLPADNSWVHTCPQRGRLARPASPGCLWGAGEPLPPSPQWA